MRQRITGSRGSPRQARTNGPVGVDRLAALERDAALLAELGEHAAAEAVREAVRRLRATSGTEEGVAL